MKTYLIVIAPVLPANYGRDDGRISLVAAVGNDAAADTALGGLAAAGCDISGVIARTVPPVWQSSPSGRAGQWGG